MAALQQGLTSSTGMSEIVTQIDGGGNACVRALKLTRDSMDDKECFVEYELSESYERFVGQVSYSSDRSAGEKLVLRILADGNEIYCSEPITASPDPIELEVFVAGAKTIRFVWEGENEPGSEEAGGAILVSDAYFLPEREEAPAADENVKEPVKESNNKEPVKESDAGTVVIIVLIVCLVAAAGFLAVKAVKNKETTGYGQEELRATYLHEMNVLQADNYYNYSDVVQDTTGTDYSGVTNFLVWNPGVTKTGSVFYHTNYEYSTLNLYAAPWKGISPSAISQLVVYVNNEARYVSPEITCGTFAFKISVDIRDAQTICLSIVSNEENGTLLLSEMKMTNA